jgi:hypothetical protein
MGGEGSLRLHPWALSVEGLLLGDEEAEDEGVTAERRIDPQVEVGIEAWGPLEPRVESPLEGVLFVDGVRRVDAGVVKQEGGHLYWGLFGSYGVGAVECRHRQARVVVEHVERRLVLGGGTVPDLLRIPCGSSVLEYRGVLSRNRQQEVRGELQRLMRDKEGALISSLGDGLLLMVDGPLTFQVPRDIPVLGYAKSHYRRYLEDPKLVQVVLDLPPGTRTPLFLIPREGGHDLLSCYARVAPSPIPRHPLVGIVRLEMWAAMGLEAAVRLADLATALIPRFASSAQWDPRAPVNLHPVAALEERLRHRLGDHGWVRRGIEQFLFRGGEES